MAKKVRALVLVAVEEAAEEAVDLKVLEAVDLKVLETDDLKVLEEEAAEEAVVVLTVLVLGAGIALVKVDAVVEHEAILMKIKGFLTCVAFVWEN